MSIYNINEYRYKLYFFRLKFTQQCVLSHGKSRVWIFCLPQVPWLCDKIYFVAWPQSQIPWYVDDIRRWFMPVEWVTDQTHFSKRLFSTLMSLIHFGSRSCNIFWQLYIIRHALAVIIIWFTISTIFTYIVHGTREILSSWDVSGISGIFQLKGGRCSSEIWCILASFWHGKKKIGRTSQTSPRALRKDCFQSYSWLFPSIPCYWRSIKMQSRDVLIAVQYGLRRLR